MGLLGRKLEDDDDDDDDDGNNNNNNNNNNTLGSFSAKVDCMIHKENARYSNVVAWFCIVHVLC